MFVEHLFLFVCLSYLSVSHDDIVTRLTDVMDWLYFFFYEIVFEKVEGRNFMASCIKSRSNTRFKRITRSEQL